MQTNFAYLAGIIDGEGTITIHRHRQHKKTIFQLRPRLTISNNSESLLNALKDRHGGSVISAGPTRPRCNPAFIWRLAAIDKIYNTLLAVRPFLIVKAQRADVMLQFLQMRKAAPYTAYSDKEMALYEEIRILNERTIKCE